MTYNDTFLKACRKEEVDHIPVWMMRQAGRYQPEYRAIKEKHSMLEICHNADLMTEITLLPIKQFSFDAAIIFSDILIPLGPMGIKFDYIGGVGPKIENPVQTVKDIEKLRPFSPEEDLSFMGQALQNLNKELNIPCIGFVGGPYTLASYMIEGGTSKNHIKVKSFMYNQPEAWGKLMHKLAENISNYLIYQAESGAQAVQIFDSWMGSLSEADYREYVFPFVKKMIARFKAKSDATLILFGVDTSHLLGLELETGADVLGIDWKTNIAVAHEKFYPKAAVQGNLDPILLFAEWNVLKQKAEQLLNEMKGKKGYIFNLGHGILPGTPIENVKRLTEFVRCFNN